jgi:glycosyltransferase involved in cell wall biosynthesis
VTLFAGAHIQNNKNTIMSVRRRILLSAYACSPLWGSECGVGWNWLMQIAKHHDVVLLTHAFFQSHIDPALKKSGVQIEIYYLQPPAGRLHPHTQLNSRLFYIWWQWCARRLVKQLVTTSHFDLIHHITWGTVRFPCWLGGLSVPLVIGPLGGGDKAPQRLYRGLPFLTQAIECIRTLSMYWAKIDPLATSGPLKAQLVLCKTQGSIDLLPKKARAKAVIAPEIGSPPHDPSLQLNPEKDAGKIRKNRLRLLFAGQLRGVKGVSIGIGCVKLLVQSGYDVEFLIAGAGPLRDHLNKQILEFDLMDRVQLLGNVERSELLELYRTADLFLFPSLHDSSGNVVLESLSRGLPVVCLDLGGPKLYVNNSCGLVVDTTGLSREQLERSLAAAVGHLLDNPQQLQQMSASAIEHAQKQSWDATVTNSYQLIYNALNWTVKH